MRRILLPVIVCFVALAGFAAGQGNKHPLQEPYTPTKLEWLATQLNSRWGYTQGQARLNYIALPPNTIKMVYLHTLDTAESDVEKNAKGYEFAIASEAMDIGVKPESVKVETVVRSR